MVNLLPSSACTADHIKVFARKRQFGELTLILDPMHYLSQDEKLGQAAYSTAIWGYV
jgi:hypothetical protein